MQRMTSNLQPAQQGSSRVHAVVLTAITLFALSGLMVGFAVGAFTHPKQSGPQNNSGTGQGATSITTQGATPSPTPTQQKVPLGCPDVTTDAASATTPAVADGNTTYTATVQAKDKTGYQPNDKCPTSANGDPIGNSLTTNGITCRIWLVKSSDGAKDVDTHMNDVKTVDDFQKPFPHELQNALILDGTNQVQSSNQGTATWKFKIAPSVEPGQYYLMVLTDWGRTYYNYNWAILNIQ